MALPTVDYQALFTRLGRIVYWMNQFQTLQGVNQTTPNTVLNINNNGEVIDIPKVYNGAYTNNYSGSTYPRNDLINGLVSQIQSQASTIAGWEQNLFNYANATLQDQQSTLISPSSNTTTILNYLYDNMVAKGYYINPNTVNAVVVTATNTYSGTGNTGNGTLLVSQLNTVTAANDQRIITEQVQLICTQDKYTGAVSGGEVFSLTGQPNVSQYGSQPLGNGTGQNVTVANANNLIANGGFENFTTNTPTSWTITAGTAGTQVFSSSTSNRGTSALKLTSDGTLATTSLVQTLTSLQGSTQYAIGVYLEKSASMSAGSTLTLSVTAGGTSYNVFSASPTTLTTSYVGHFAFFTTPESTTSTSTVNIQWNGSNAAGSGNFVLIDDYVAIQPVIFGDVNYAIMAGTIDFLQNDGYQVQTSNTYSGVFQTWFGRYYDVFLPNTGGTLIPETLATSQTI